LTKEDGGKRFYWPAIAGQWKPHIGGGTPRDFGPVVMFLTAIVRCCSVRRKEIHLLSAGGASRPRGLLVPFYLGGKAVGTIWAVAHDDHKFDAEDERLMKSLGSSRRQPIRP